MLSFENVAKLLPHAQQLVNSKYETHILAGLNSTLNILCKFERQIMDTKHRKLSDPDYRNNRELQEQMRKCQACVEKFRDFVNSKGFKKALLRDGEVNSTSRKLEAQIVSLLSEFDR